MLIGNANKNNWVSLARFRNLIGLPRGTWNVVCHVEVSSIPKILLYVIRSAVFKRMRAHRVPQIKPNVASPIKVQLRDLRLRGTQFIISVRQSYGIYRYSSEYMIQIPALRSALKKLIQLYFYYVTSSMIVHSIDINIFISYGMADVKTR